MNCSQFEEILHELDRPGTNGFAGRDAAFAHAESCDQCMQLLTQSEALDFAFRTISERTGREQAPPGTEAALLNEFRRRKAAASRVRSWQIAAVGIAAVLLLGLAARFHYGPSETANTTESAKPTAASKAAREDTDTAVPAPSVANRQQEVAENQGPDPESAAPFIALPYADDALNSEGATIVRVILSRPALASLGLPVSDIGTGDRIPADIVMSEDGAPQAIRLVAQSDMD